MIRSAHDMGIRCVAVYVDADADAPFVHDADEAVRLPGSYLDGDAILEAARRPPAPAPSTRATASSPRTRASPSQVGAAGLAWVGPSPEAIAQMGDKIAAKALAEKAQVPTLPGSEEPGAAAQVGFPLAREGRGRGRRQGHAHRRVCAEGPGGGRRSRRSARPWAASATTGSSWNATCRAHGTSRSRSWATHHGNVVHLGERECSIQRRHQKILEESPSPRVDDGPAREAMGEAALRLARELGYRSAGTVEFLVDDDTGEFFFLEVNTRLQVEHPVTEFGHGHRSGARAAAHRRRRAARLRAGDIRFEGAAIEARLYAEDPSRNDFLPATGTLAAFAPAANAGAALGLGRRGRARWSAPTSIPCSPR